MPETAGFELFNHSCRKQQADLDNVDEGEDASEGDDAPEETSAASGKQGAAGDAPPRVGPGTADGGHRREGGGPRITCSGPSEL